MECVGKGGMSPEYFKTQLRPYEAQKYLEGVDKRRHDGWEQAREILVAMCGKEVREKVRFPWEKDEPVAEEEILTPEKERDLLKFSEVATEIIRKKHG